MNEQGLTVSELQSRAHENARNKGFWDQPREFGTLIALIHSELSEALEADRKGDIIGVAEELADTVIRMLDLCGGYNIDLEYAIKLKMEINKGRPKLHGKRY